MTEFSKEEGQHANKDTARLKPSALVRQKQVQEAYI